MPKMTMNFEVRKTNELGGLQVGDTISFHVYADQNESWIEEFQRANSNEVQQLPPADPSSVALLHAATLKTGDLMPDAELLSEDGRTIHFSDFEGKVLSSRSFSHDVLFRYFCPRMNRNFSRTRELLLQQPDAPLNLAISFYFLRSRVRQTRRADAVTRLATAAKLSDHCFLLPLRPTS